MVFLWKNMEMRMKVVELVQRSVEVVKLLEVAFPKLQQKFVGAHSK